jgi:Ala-tRNA(Pro) deacylase
MIFEFLDANLISYQRVDHPPVYTCEEARRLVPSISGAETKNLFLRDGKGKLHFLLAVPAEKNVDLRSLAGVLGVSGLGFASAERLKKYLGLEPGAVTLLGAISDTSKEVQILIDRQLWESDAILCHPLVNTSTISISKEELKKFFELTGHLPQVLDVTARMA